MSEIKLTVDETKLKVVSPTWIVILGGSHADSSDFDWIGPFASKEQAEAWSMKYKEDGRAQDLSTPEQAAECYNKRLK